MVSYRNPTLYYTGVKLVLQGDASLYVKIMHTVLIHQSTWIIEKSGPTVCGRNAFTGQ